MDENEIALYMAKGVVSELPKEIQDKIYDFVATSIEAAKALELEFEGAGLMAAGLTSLETVKVFNV